MLSNFEKITIYRCKICNLDCETIEHAKFHFETTKEINELNFEGYKKGQIIRVKHKDNKQYTLCKIEDFEYSNFDHELRIFVDRYCENRDLDQYSRNDIDLNTSMQCSSKEILKKEDISNYSIFEFDHDSCCEQLTEEMVDD